jgi:hypothetical protein
MRVELLFWLIISQYAACAHCAASISLSAFAVIEVDVDIGDTAC